MITAVEALQNVKSAEYHRFSISLQIQSCFDHQTALPCPMLFVIDQGVVKSGRLPDCDLIMM